MENKNNLKKFGIPILAVALVGTGAFVMTKNSEYIDGTYRVESDSYDNQGWKPFLEMTFKDGEIKDVVFDYTNQEDGRLKTSDDAYNNRMLSIIGVNPRIYTREYAVEIITKQSLEDFDGVSGATHSTAELKVMAEEIFKNALKGDTETKVIKVEV